MIFESTYFCISEFKNKAIIVFSSTVYVNFYVRREILLDDVPSFLSPSELFLFSEFF